MSFLERNGHGKGNARPASHLDEVQNNNRALVIKAIHDSEEPTRTTLTQATGLNRATITNIVGDLIRFGLVKEGPAIASTKGRQPILLSFSDDNYRILGVRITRSYFVAGVYGPSQICYGSRRIDFAPGSTAPQIQQRLVDTLEDLHRLARTFRLLGIGVSMPGPVSLNGTIDTPIVGFPGWEIHDVKGRLREAFGLPVMVEKDANAAALLEWYLRAKNDDIMMYLDMGHGVGSSLVLGGELYKGARGGAGEIGDSYLQPVQTQGGFRRRLEQYCTSPFLLQWVQREAGEGCPGNWSQLVEAYRGGHPKVVELAHTCARAAGEVVAYLINLINPNTVVVAGELAQLGQPFVDRIACSAERFTLPTLFRAVSIELPRQLDRPLCAAGANIIWDALVHNPAAFLQPFGKTPG